MPYLRLPPWHYRRDTIPTQETLGIWRRLAVKLARKVGARTACGICHRPVNQWGAIFLKHPKSYGRTRRRKTCITCANLLIQMVDVLSWYGAYDHLPPESWIDKRNVTPPYPKEDTGQDPGVDARDPWWTVTKTHIRPGTKDECQYMAVSSCNKCGWTKPAGDT